MGAVQSHAVPCNPMQSHAISCNPMQSHAIPCNPVQTAAHLARQSRAGSPCQGTDPTGSSYSVHSRATCSSHALCHTWSHTCKWQTPAFILLTSSLLATPASSTASSGRRALTHDSVLCPTLAREDSCNAQQWQQSNNLLLLPSASKSSSSLSRTSQQLPKALAGTEPARFSPFFLDPVTLHHYLCPNKVKLWFYPLLPFLRSILIPAYIYWLFVFMHY